jgi:hypothetical protein
MGSGSARGTAWIDKGQSCPYSGLCQKEEKIEYTIAHPFTSCCTLFIRFPHAPSTAYPTHEHLTGGLIEV